MTLSNLGFEDDDAGTPGVGIPEAWTVSVTTAAEQVAAWGSATPPLDEDGFESEWDNDAYLFAFGIGDTLPTLLDTSVSEGEAVEDFEEGWDDNQGYLFEMNTGDDALFDASLTPQAVEDFEDGWDSGASAGNDYETSLGSSTAASFDALLTPQDVEDFEDGWSGTGAGNDYETTLATSTAASFDGGAGESFEDFEETVSELQVTADPSTNLFTASGAHGLSAGSRVSFRVSTSDGGALPAGLNSSFRYYVIASGLSSTEFRISTTSGGAQLDVTDAGLGTFYVVRDRTLFWIVTLP